MADHGKPSGDPLAHDFQGEHHIVPKRTYFLVFTGLIILTWVTAWISTVELGALNTVVALSIAVVKASLVIFFFMHVAYGTRLTKLIVGAGMFWLILLLFIAMFDYWTRGWVGVPGR